jgi:hypothetical protein
VEDWQSLCEVYTILAEIVVTAPQSGENDGRDAEGANPPLATLTAIKEAEVYKRNVVDLKSKLERNRMSITFDPEIEGSSKLG